MLELILIVCLHAQPATCEEIYLSLPGGEGGMMQCIFSGQKEAVRWAEQNPGWFVKRWNCGLPRV